MMFDTQTVHVFLCNNRLIYSSGCKQRLLNTANTVWNCTAAWKRWSPFTLLIRRVCPEWIKGSGVLRGVNEGDPPPADAIQQRRAADRSEGSLCSKTNPILEFRQLNEDAGVPRPPRVTIWGSVWPVCRGGLRGRQQSQLPSWFAYVQHEVEK